MYVDGGETVICLSNHLTSFAVLVDTAGTTPVSIYITIVHKNVQETLMSISLV